MMTAIIEFIKKYMLWLILAVAVLFFGKLFRRRAPRRRRRVVSKPAARRTSTRRTMPRSVGTSRGKGYPAAGGGTIPFKYNKDGTIKKAQFVAGTLAAKRRMATLRKNR
jgi:hypothetical protein